MSNKIEHILMIEMFYWLNMLHSFASTLNHMASQKLMTTSTWNAQQQGRWALFVRVMMFST
jgi:hypothetical protein